MNAPIVRVVEKLNIFGCFYNMQGDGLRGSVVFVFPAYFLIDSDTERLSVVFRSYLHLHPGRSVLQMISSPVHKVHAVVVLCLRSISRYVLPRLKVEVLTEFTNTERR